jgi:hypothetical protein
MYIRLSNILIKLLKKSLTIFYFILTNHIIINSFININVNN